VARSKYAHIIQKLKLKVDLGTAPDYQAKVDLVKTKILETTPRHATALAKRYVEVRTAKDELKSQLESTQLEVTALEQLLADQYEAEGVTNLKIDGLGSVRVTPEPSAKVKDRDAFRLWCIDNGYERSLTLPWQTTNAVLKQRLTEGMNEPDGIEAFYRNGVFFTREK